MKKLCENRKSAPYISLLYHFLLAEAGLLTVVYPGILRQMKDGALPCSWGAFGLYVCCLSLKYVLLSGSSKPVPSEQSTVFYSWTKNQISSTLLFPKAGKNIYFCCLTAACLRTHTDSHSFGGQTQLPGMTNKNYICNHLFVLKKK